MTESPQFSPASALPEFTPVPRKNTVTHGWTVAKQRDFIAGLAATGSVRLATEGVGMSYTGVYALRTAPGGSSFARAWDIAVGMGAARIRDVLFGHAIHGIPETIITGKETRIERRRFNHRTMIWALQHHMPDQYPGGSTLASGSKREQWQAEETRIDEVRAGITQKLEVLRRAEMEAIAQDPARRAAYDVLHPGHDNDWDAIADGARGGGGAG